eukprot:TRINITY_DN34727_c0_g1_i3.p1 TRINITY_DN34727_c0_g1~~TRINITY_DN34727_c0_g1_i3.p1  ORF type:complete len:712 (-),score=116.83 TRINITY_DN34727_c0_g1_i3:135-2270(-)
MEAVVAERRQSAAPASKPRPRSPSNARYQPVQPSEEEAEKLARSILERHVTGQLGLMHQQAVAAKPVNAECLSLAHHAAPRRRGLTWFTEQFARQGYKDEWLADMVLVLDRAVAAADATQVPAGLASPARPASFVTGSPGRLQAGGSTSSRTRTLFRQDSSRLGAPQRSCSQPASPGGAVVRSPFEREESWLAAALIALKVSEAEAMLDIHIRDIVLVLAKSQRSPRLWQRVRSAEMNLLKQLDYRVTLPSLLTFTMRLGMEMSFAAQDVQSGSTGNWPGAEIAHLPAPSVGASSPRLGSRETSMPRFLCLATMLVELAIAHEPTACQAADVPPAALAFASLRLSLEAFGEPTLAACERVLQDAEVRFVDEAGSIFVEKQAEMEDLLYNLWREQLPSVSKTAKKWDERSATLGGRLPGAPTEARRAAMLAQRETRRSTFVVDTPPRSAGQHRQDGQPRCASVTPSPLSMPTPTPAEVRHDAVGPHSSKPQPGKSEGEDRVTCASSSQAAAPVVNRRLTRKSSLGGSDGFARLPAPRALPVTSTTDVASVGRAVALGLHENISPVAASPAAGLAAGTSAAPAAPRRLTRKLTPRNSDAGLPRPNIMLPIRSATPNEQDEVKKRVQREDPPPVARPRRARRKLTPSASDAGLASNRGSLDASRNSSGSAGMVDPSSSSQISEARRHLAEIRSLGTTASDDGTKPPAKRAKITK